MRSGRRSSVVPPKDQTCLRIERMQADREARRKKAERNKAQRAQEHQANVAAGNPGDVDFIGMVRRWRAEHAVEANEYENAFEGHSRLCVCVRKRPISEKERERNDHDSITCLNPNVWVHAAKKKVDGITKYLDHSSFCFDHAFGEDVSTEDVYTYSTLPLLNHCCQGTGVRATVFCYGQTGSGKTHTMNGIQELLCHDLFAMLQEPDDKVSCSASTTKVMVSFFEFYGGHAQDLLNERQRLKLLEDGKNEIVVVGLRQVEATNAQHLATLLEEGHQGRTTHQTEANDTSSRSHAICQICLRHRQTDKLQGKLSLVDLAGSERGSDTRSHNAMRRSESADINTSLLSLKECIRALDKNNQSGRASHVPYRGSKLTLLLKDCFTSTKALTTMIATVSPGASAADHSLNTLRYADRIKEKRMRKSPQRSQSGSAPSHSNSASPHRAQSVSPRRPMDTTNQPTNRRASHKPVSMAPPAKRQTRASTATSRLSRPMSSRTNLATASSFDSSRITTRSGGIHTANSTDSRQTSRSMPVSRSASIDEDVDLDSLLSDDVSGLNGSYDSTFLDPPAIVNSHSGNSRSDALFEPPPISKTNSSASGESLLLDGVHSSKSDDRSYPGEATSGMGTRSRSSSHSSTEIMVLDSSDKRGQLDSPARNTKQQAKLQALHDAFAELHMQAIQENADLVMAENEMVQEFERSNFTEKDAESYILALEAAMDRKQFLINQMQEKVIEYEQAKVAFEV